MKELYETKGKNFEVINVDKTAVNNFDKILENFYKNFRKKSE